MIATGFATGLLRLGHGRTERRLQAVHCGPLLGLDGGHSTRGCRLDLVLCGGQLGLSVAELGAEVIGAGALGIPTLLPQVGPGPLPVAFLAKTVDQGDGLGQLLPQRGIRLPQRADLARMRCLDGSEGGLEGDADARHVR